ncbi:uncharacterized protein SAPINGB_P006180 [Magnusiomyces paraingens]|uniref:Phosphatidylinositol transfer protein SFH5 n=1 Tax=Magnusiomyces paraingens TaxID=2606893 RepID=A0A5E8CAT1_9ASCO|nr:uncharacterized protein SAPINGB_P006180 [Saprochaete ingens]VVT58386.1 unnamed protein product [Saprochaete ingens]
MSDPKSTQINKLQALLTDIIDSVGYSELYGYDLLTIAEIEKGTTIRDRFLDKFLVANNYDVQLASQQLKDTLAWRKKFNPLSAGFLEKHDDKLSQIGIITSVPITPKAAEKIFTPSFQEDAISEESSVVDGLPEAVDEPTKESGEADEEHEQNREATTTTTTTTTNNTASEAEESEVPATSTASTASTAASDNLVVTWNLYGRVPNRAEVFGNLDAFLRYRVGLMERGLAALDFTKPETSYMAQVHDYNNVSFLRLDAPTKAASKATIDIFTKYYPELLNVKYFVNVPRIMSWVFSFTRMFLPKATLDKFHVVSDGHDLALQTGNVWVPLEYGGNAESFDAIVLPDIEPRDSELVTKYDPTVKPAAVPTEPVPTATDATAETATETEEVAAPEPGAVPEPIKKEEQEEEKEEEEAGDKTATTFAAPEPGAVPEEPLETTKVEEEETKEASAPEVTEAPTVTKAAEIAETQEVETAAIKEVETKTDAIPTVTTTV